MPSFTRAQLLERWSRFHGVPALTESLTGTIRLGPNRFLSGGGWALQNPIPDAEDYQSYFLMTDAAGNFVWEVKVNDTTRQSLGLQNSVATENGDGYAISLGYDSTHEYRYQVSRFDSLGNFRWHRWLPGKVSSVENKYVWALPDGVLANDSKFGRGGRAGLTQLNGAGRIRWQRTSSRQSDATDVVALADGSYAWLTNDIWRVTGTVNIYYGRDLKILRLSPAGDSLGCVYLADPGYDVGDRLRATSDGGLLIIGRNSIPPFNTPQRAVVIKLNASWQEQWRYTMTVPNGTNDSGAWIIDAVELTNGHYLLLSLIPAELQEIAPPPRGDSVATRLWTLPLPSLAGQPTIASHLMLDNDPAGTLRLFGHWSTFSPFNVDTWRATYTGVSAPQAVVNYCAIPPGPPAASYQAIRLDSLLFSLDATATDPGPPYAEISRVDWDWGDGTAPDSGCIVGHRFALPTPVRVRCTVTNNLFCTSITDLFPFGPLTGVQETAELAASVSVYPNPSASGHFTLRVGADAPRPALAVSDALGRIIWRGTVTGPETCLDLSPQSSGLYFLRLTWSDGQTTLKKLVR